MQLLVKGTRRIIFILCEYGFELQMKKRSTEAFFICV